MTDTVAELVERGKALSPQERTQLVELLRTRCARRTSPRQAS